MKEELNNEIGLPGSLKENNPFNVPANYFEELPGKVINKIEAIPEFSTSIKNPFEVPEAYFEKLQSSIQEKISAKKSTSWKKIFRPAISIPAFLLLAALIFFISNRLSKDQSSDVICADDLKNTSYLQSMDEYLLVDYLVSQNVTENDQSLEQYLIDNDVDLSELENEL